MPKFKGMYYVDDGYIGKSRPHYFEIDDFEIEGDMTDGDLEELYENIMISDFENKIHPYSQNVDEFIQWAKEQIVKNREEDGD